MFREMKNFLFGVEKKSVAPFSPFMSFVNFLAFNGWSNLSAYQAMQYYIQVSPLYDAVNKISKECSSTRLFLQDCVTEKFIKQHPLLDKLAHPNTDICRREFMEQLISYFLITGNCYIVATGKPPTPPLDLFCISPEYVTLIPSKDDGYTQTIAFTSSARSVFFERKVVKGFFRFYSEDMTREIYHIRQFNPIRGITNNYGLSPLSPIYYEVEQYIKAGLHNLSLLVRGARPSGAYQTEETLSDSAFSRLQEQMERFTSGPENAGRPMLLDGGLKWLDMGFSNRDMDFEKLKERLITQIYNSYSIPLPLIAAGHMSYNNLETAKLSLYDFAVLPVLGRILEELSNFLMYRYEDSDKLELVYNKDSIPALQLRRNEELSLTQKLGVNSINEIRRMKGDLPAKGGDTIYTGATNVPAARVSTEELEEETENYDALDSDKALYLDYYVRMKNRTDAQGLPLYTNEQIKKLAIKYGLFE